MKPIQHLFRKPLIKVACLLVAGTTMLISTPVMAAGFADIFNNLSGQFPALLKLVTIGAYVIGGILVFKALLDFKKHWENPQQVKLSAALIALVIGAALIALPVTVTKTSESMFGSGAQSQGIQGTDNLFGN